jgi:hypothetical protein
MNTIYKERPSKTGEIMTNPRLKSEILSETAKKRVQEKFIEDNFGVTREFWSKETNKGTECEPESIKYFVKNYDLFGASKNEITYENDFFIGTPDIIHAGIVYDIKTSWSLFTFPMFDDTDKIPTKAYEYQLQAYMDLTGLKSARLVYVLTDATEEMIQDEVYKRCLRSKIFNKAPEVAAQLEEKIEKQTRLEMTFSHVPDELRIKIFSIDYNPEMIKEMRERVDLCRTYYSELLEKVNNQIISKNN